MAAGGWWWFYSPPAGQEEGRRISVVFFAFLLVVIAIIGVVEFMMRSLLIFTYKFEFSGDTISYEASAAKAATQSRD